MTVQTNNNSIAYVGNGSTVHFDYDFLVLDASHLKVYFGGALQTSGYVVSGVLSQTGGTVAFAVAPPNGTEITLTRSVPFLQLTDYQPYDAFPAESHERALDLLTMMAQQLKDASGRSMQYPVGGNKWDARGNEIVNVGTGSSGTSATNVDQVKYLIASEVGDDPSASASVRAREALRRSYAEVGYNLVDGSFEAGGVLNNASEALLHYLTGKAYYGAGPFPQGVSEGTDPLSGGFTSVEIKNAYVGNYTGLRRYAGAASLVYITGVLPTAKPDGVAGFFVYDATDTTSTDDGGTVIVGDDGRRWKRQYNGIPSVLWWGAKPDWNGVTGTDNTAALQAAHNAHAVLFYPYGSYKTGSITLTKFGATLVGPGELYGMAELAYTGSGALFTCTAGVSYVQFNSGMYLHGIPAVATDYYNTGSIAIDTTAGNTSLIFDGSWVSSFEILFNSNYNSFYNRFTNNRLERFRIGLNKFSNNNLHIEKNRISRFNTALVVNGANGPLVIDKNAFEVFNGPIASMTGVEQGEIVFTNNYVELYDSVNLPTNFPASEAPNTTKFGGNILFTGPIGSFKQSGNDLQIGGCFRLMTASLHVDVIESVGNNIHIFTTGNNLDRLWAAPSVGSININDRLGITQGNGGYSRTYAGSPLAQLNPNRPYFFYDCIAGKSFRANAETSALALLNGWVNPDANHGVARVHKRNGDTMVSGVIDGTANTGIVAFTIPASHRPDEISTTRAYANFSCFSAYGGGTIVRLRYLYSTGEMRLEGSPASLAGVLLDGITIPVRT